MLLMMTVRVIADNGQELWSGGSTDTSRFNAVHMPQANSIHNLCPGSRIETACRDLIADCPFEAKPMPVLCSADPDATEIDTPPSWAKRAA